MRLAVLTTLIAAFVLAPAIALAHPGHGETSGLAYGLAHPISGIDHVLAMVAVGLLSAHVGGRASWLGRVLINLRQCPLRSDTDRFCGPATNDAKGHERKLVIRLKWKSP
jgi:hypothetical protein